MASQVNPPRGMRDFLPADKARREHVLSVIRRTFREHGFDEIETPVVEDSARLHAGLGGDNEKLSFAVMKRDLKPEQLERAAASGDSLELADLGLRFDLTVPLARFYASHRAELPGVFRSLQIAPVWRAERPQKGRYRQFVQCDIDIIGESSALAEIELITATAATLEALGFAGDNACTIRINDRRILRTLTEYMQVPPEQHESALITLDKEDKIGYEGVIAELKQKGIGNLEVVALALSEYVHLVNGGWNLLDGEVTPRWLNVDAYRELLAIRDAVGPGIELVFSPNLVRGMGYYTGTIFEIAHPDLPYSLGGGGRYDGMIGRFLGTEVPATGFSLGFERLVDLVCLPEDESASAVALVYDPGVLPAQLTALKSELIAAGVRATLIRRTKNTTVLLDQVASAGYPRFAFVDSSSRSVADLEIRNIAAQ